MRFEIRAPGAIAILLSVVALSGAVFALGLIAGHEMARQNQPDQNQLSTTYPLPPASEAASAPAVSAASSPAAASSTASSAASMSAASVPKIPAPVLAAKPPPAAPAAPAVARANPPGYAPAMKPPAAARPSSSDEEEDESTASAEAPAAAAPPAAGMPHKPYNIQIEAVMDKSGADEMVSRLKTLGYTAQELKTNLNGQVWYRVQVGPYNSEDEARAAQDKLRQQYRQAYTTSH